jgi:hypothetical protein
VQFAGKKLFSQSLQPPEVVVLDISPGLTEPRRDLSQGVSFEKMEPQRFPLVKREFFKDSLKTCLSKYLVDRMSSSSAGSVRIVQFTAAVTSSSTRGFRISSPSAFSPISTDRTRPAVQSIATSRSLLNV